MLVDAVAAKDQHLAATQGDAFDIRHGHGAVAHHACRIVPRTTEWRRFAQVSIGIVDRQCLGGLVRPGAHAIDTAVADPGDEPLRQQHAGPRAQRHGRRAGGPCPARDAPADLAIGAEQRVTDRRCIDSAPVQCQMQTRHQFAACLRRHRTATHAIGHDEHRRGAVEGAVTVLVDLPPPAACARRRHLQTHPQVRADGVAASRGTLAYRRIVERGRRFVRRDDVHACPPAARVRAITFSPASIASVGIPARGR